MPALNDVITVPYQTLIDIAADVAWYDMLVIDTSTLQAKIDGMEVNEFRDIDRADVPKAAWAEHRATFDAKEHGLALRSVPSIIGIVRHWQDGSPRLLIGYQLV